MNKTVMVTGASGYIGSQTCKELSLRGYTVIGVDNIASPPAAKYINEFVISDYTNSYDIMVHFNVDSVIHTAATSIVGPSFKDPKPYYVNNITKMKQFMDYCIEAGVSRVVYSSSASVYGEVSASRVFSENTPTVPCNPYGHSKLFGEWIGEDYARAYGLEFVALRYMNVAGADPEDNLGQRGKATHLITVALQKVLAGEPIVINGDDFDTPDGTCIRDYVHVKDIAAANVDALTVKTNDENFGHFNISSGVQTSNLEIIEEVKRVTGQDLPYTFGPRRAGDPTYLVSSSEKFTGETDWRPLNSSLQNIIESAYLWQKENIS